MNVTLVVATTFLVALFCVGLVVAIVVWLDWHKKHRD
jgi:hypothetical protein